jgi:hypothetical protein
MSNSEIANISLVTPNFQEFSEIVETVTSNEWTKERNSAVRKVFKYVFDTKISGQSLKTPFCLSQEDINKIQEFEPDQYDEWIDCTYFGKESLCQTVCSTLAKHGWTIIKNN